MKLLLAIVIIWPIISNASELPREVRNFVDERNLCDHFRGEGYEGSSERSEYVRDSLDIYCSGSDKRLAALKRRFKEQEKIIDLLNKYEENID